MRPSVRLLVGGTCAATLLGCGPPAESPPIAVASTPIIAVGPTVAPAGFAKSGLPVGVQIVGPEYGDLTCIEVARLLEQGFQPFVPPKGFP